jgi:hypothetical protein
MSPEEFIDYTRDTHGKYKACYLAVIENDDHYDVEVEIPNHNIAGTFETKHPINEAGLENARAAADVMEAHLTELGVKVYETRDEWEESDDFTNDED